MFPDPAHTLHSTTLVLCTVTTCAELVVARATLRTRCIREFTLTTLEHSTVRFGRSRFHTRAVVLTEISTVVTAWAHTLVVRADFALRTVTGDRTIPRLTTVLVTDLSVTFRGLRGSVVRTPSRRTTGTAHTRFTAGAGRRTVPLGAGTVTDFNRLTILATTLATRTTDTCLTLTVLTDLTGRTGEEVVPALTGL